MPRRRVLVLTPDFPPAIGGIQTLVHRLVEGWRHLEPRVVTLAAPGSRQVDASLRATVRRADCGLPCRHDLRLGALSAAALVEAVRFRPDVVLSAHLVMAPASWAISRGGRIPFVQYVHGAEAALRPGLARAAARRADAVIAVSSYAVGLISDSGGAGRCYQIPPGVDIPAATRTPRAVDPLVVTVARLAVAYKGQDVLIRALPLLRARLPHVNLAIVGDGPLRPYYAALATANGVQAQVHFTGAVPDEGRDVWFDRAHVFAMPARLDARGGGEGFGIVYLEAGAHGVPVVAGNVAGACDAVVDGRTGVLVDPADHVAVAEAIGDLLVDQRRARAMGQAGQIRAREFAWPRIAERVERVLLDVAERRDG